MKELAHAASLKIGLQLMAAPLVSAGGNAGAWRVRRILSGTDALLTVLGRRERWCVEHPENSVWN